MPDTFDAIVIGSGIGGLTAARLLSAFGRKRVLVLEQHTTLGGLTHVFSRPKSDAGPDYEFATGVHYLGRNAEAASLPALLAQLTEDRVQWHALPDPYDVVAFPGWSFGIPGDEATYRLRLTERFPEERAALERFFRDSRRAAKGLVAATLVSGLPGWARPFGRWLLKRFTPLAFERTQAYLDRRFADRRLKALLAAQWGDYGSPPSVAAFGVHAMVLRHFIGGAVYPIGGPARITEPIIDILRRDGCELRSGQVVRDIMIEQGRAVGVRVTALRTGENYEVRAPLIVSDAGLRNTYDALLPETMRARFAGELARLADSPSALVLFLGLKQSPATLGFNGANHWLFPSEDHDAAAEAAPGEGLIYLSFPSLKNPAAANHTVEVVSFVHPEPFRKWAAESWPRRAPEYLELKQRLRDRLLERIDVYAPGFRDLVAFAELATPATFATFQHSHLGAFYGIDCSPERLLSPLTASRTEIPGLFLSGQDTLSPGILGALLGGLFAASAALAPRERGRLWTRLSLTRAPPTPFANRPWRGFLRVAAIREETPTVKSFRLEDPDGGPLPFAFASGQFLTLSLPMGGGTVRRHYSIASPAAERRYCTITVKRESLGLVSQYLHDAVELGRCLLVEAPAGRFTLADEASGAGLPPAAVLISGGVGITPIMSVLRQLNAAKAPLPITLIAAFRTPEEIIFREELESLARSMPNLRLCLLVEHAGAAWQGTIGRPTKLLIAGLAGAQLATARIHLCGPRPMMDAVKAMLAELAVAPDRIHTEDFTTPVEGTNKARDRAIQQIAAAAASSGRAIPSFTVAFRSSGRVVEAAAGQSLLDAALAHGISLHYVCGAGICGECRLRIARGTVETEDPLGVLTASEREQGYVLACRSYPTSHLEVAA